MYRGDPLATPGAGVTRPARAREREVDRGGQASSQVVTTNAMLRSRENSLTKCALGLVVAVLMATACDPGPPRDRLGLVAQEGGPRVLVHLCPEERIQDVTLFRVEGNVVGDENDEVLWRVSSDRGAKVEEFVIGSTPSPAFETVQQFRPPLQGEHLSVQVRTSLTRFHLSFASEELESRGFVTSGEGGDSPEEFRDRQPQCP